MAAKALLCIVGVIVLVAAAAVLLVFSRASEGDATTFEFVDSPTGWRIIIESRNFWGGSDSRVRLVPASTLGVDRPAVVLVPWGRAWIHGAEWLGERHVRIIGMTRDGVVDFPTGYDEVSIDYQLKY